MKNGNWLKTLLVFLSLTSFILTFLLYNTNTRYNKFESTYKHQTDSLEVLSDSLREELFISTHENGVEEMVLDSLFSKYPKLQNEHDYIKYKSNLFE